MARLLLALALAACATDPSDDPKDWAVDTSGEYAATLSEPRFVVPSSATPLDVDLPLEVTPMASNNNLDLVRHDGRLYLAWRSAPLHFASKDTVMFVLSSDDDGATWAYETFFAMGSDVREPRLLSFRGTLTLHWFQGGTDLLKFEPKALWRARRTGPFRWSEPEEWGVRGEVPWGMKVRDGRAWLTSYDGVRYSTEQTTVRVFFRVSDDGVTWQPVKGDGVVYSGGISEVAFEFTAAGELWAIGRNEDGDASGFGSNLCTAPADDLGTWTCDTPADPERYDSPEMIRHGDDLYILGRRDVGGPFDEGRRELTLDEQRTEYARHYWTRPKRMALYRIDQAARRVRHVLDFPSAGDTSFPAPVRTGPHSWLVGNYTSPLEAPDIGWIEGQGEGGTSIYLIELGFSPVR